MNKKLLIILIIVGVFIVAGGILCLLELRLKPLNILVTTDKTEYIKGENVKILIRNGSRQSFRFYGVDYQKFENNEWVFVKDTDCPCNTMCKSMPITLDSNSTKEFTWDQKEEYCSEEGTMISNQVLPGQYKIIVSSFGTPWGYSSNEFNIK
jgi:hypothetical protein